MEWFGGLGKFKKMKKIEWNGIIEMGTPNKFFEMKKKVCNGLKMIWKSDV